MKPRHLIPITFLLCVFPFGCRHSRLSSYPDFPEHKENLGNLTVISDCMIVQALRGDMDKIDLVENKDVGIRVLQISADMLRQKGYSVHNTMLSSIGLLMNHNQFYRVARTVEDRQLDDAALQQASAPFYVDKALSSDSTFLVRLAYVYNALINMKVNDDGPKRIVPEAVGLGNAIGNGEIGRAHV